MLGLGGFELLAILTIALVLFGPKELPKIAKQIARVIHEAKSVLASIKSHVSDFSKSAEGINDEADHDH